MLLEISGKHNKLPYNLYQDLAREVETDLVKQMKIYSNRLLKLSKPNCENEPDRLL